MKITKIEIFRRSVEHLHEVYDYEVPSDKAVILTGIIGLFQLSFELAWKAMKEALTHAGFSEAASGSPRSIIKNAYQAGMIKDQDLWLSMLADRNDSSHSYDESAAEAIILRIRESYYPALKQLADEIEEKWM